MTDFDFEPKRVLKHKNHVTINEGEQFEEQVSHLEYDGDEFTELKRNEAARKYGSKKIVRDLDFNSRDGLKVKDSGLGKTPDWFDQIIPFIDWDKYQTFLYELDHLWLNMFFVRELYGEERTGREQILALKRDGEQFGFDVLAQLDYDSNQLNEAKDSDIDGFIEVELLEYQPSENVTEMDVDVTFKQSVFDEDEEHISGGLQEILTGICLKHGYTGEQIKFTVELENEELTARIIGKDFNVRFDTTGTLDEDVSPWVLEIFRQDGCPVRGAEISE